jgi:hypothetical protein
MARLSISIALAGLALAHGAPAAPARGACPVRYHLSIADAARQARPQSARLIVRLWLRAVSTGRPAPCRLTATGYTPTTPPVDAYSVVFIRAIKQQPGHRLYLVVLIGKTRAVRYVLDLAPTGEGGWVVDLWAEL